MTNEEHNTALYQKMFAEQETFRDWLKDQPQIQPPLGTEQTKNAPQSGKQPKAEETP